MVVESTRSGTHHVNSTIQRWLLQKRTQRLTLNWQSSHTRNAAIILQYYVSIKIYTKHSVWWILWKLSWKSNYTIKCSPFRRQTFALQQKNIDVHIDKHVWSAKLHCISILQQLWIETATFSDIFFVSFWSGKLECPYTRSIYCGYCDHGTGLCLAGWSCTVPVIG